MSAVEVTYYIAKCDECGHTADTDDYGGEFSAFADHGTAIEMLSDDWFTDGDGDICPSCTKCEVCETKPAYRADDHMVCEEHEDHDFNAAAPVLPLGLVNTHWHRKCSDMSKIGPCGMYVTVSHEIAGVSQYMPQPEGKPDRCVCGSKYGPWMPGLAPDDRAEGWK
ncbi:hypothetical protein [Rhodococcoides kyotonense]|uniref:Uncharacterized protein n=1 Tax=Rhodococcoides kyotonense TaxID=398843 RepID=A0A239FRJ0_9NOCA|nr:hypothetical protein [Rhodococcus kyotonensis]SNS59405.1 hypothetical protein SAMN05421642_103420 [Rhodococcus kyotonensis]